jgi:hypothetical protein
MGWIILLGKLMENGHGDDRERDGRITLRWILGKIGCEDKWTEIAQDRV